MKNRTDILAKVALFMAAIIWGSTFVIVKDATATMTASFILALRFSVGTVGLILIYFKKLKVVDRSYLKCGFIMGLTLFLSFWIQVFGLTLDTTPGKSAFLSATYCIIVPFLYWVIIKEKPDKYNFVAALICILGIALVSLNENLHITGGDLMTLISGFFAAANIIATSLYCKNKDALILTIIQLAVVALLSWVIVIITKGIPGECSFNSIIGVIYLGIFATAIGLVFQSIGIKYTNPSSAALILSLEAVFGVIFSTVIFNEKITIKLSIGFLLILIAVIISETKLRFFKKKEEICSQEND